MNTSQTAGERTIMQPLLFDALPVTEPVRRAGRRAPRSDRPRSMAEPVAVEVLRDTSANLADAGGGLFAAAASPPRVVYTPAPFDPAALTNPELRALVQALSDQRLAHLLIEASRELKRRVAPEGWDGDSGSEDTGDHGETGLFEPSPLLLRAARQAAGELSGDDG